MKKLLLTLATLLGLLMAGSANAITITNSLGGEYISAGFSYQSQFAIEDDLLEAGFDDDHPYEFTMAYIEFSFTDDAGETTSTTSATDFYRTGPTTEHRDVTTTYSNEIETVDTHVGEYEIIDYINGTLPLISGSSANSNSNTDPIFVNETNFGSREENYTYACGLFTLCDGTRTVDYSDMNYDRNEGYNTGSFTILHTLTVEELASLVDDNFLDYFIKVTEGDLIFNSVSLTFDVAPISVAAVPIPPALFLFGSGLLGLLRIARVRRK